MKTLTAPPPSDPATSIDRSPPPFPRHLNEIREHGLCAEKAKDTAPYASPSQRVCTLAGALSANHSPDPVTPMTTKVCVKCKQEKPLLEFHKNSRSADGLHSYCKECNRAQALAHIKAEKARKALLRAAKKAAASSQ
ncbi:MAG: hypothetical protein AW11_00802 [Candidatus Accumulibacter regalis]|jgi:hypothetical protein|uniref:Uncharacterized protein n=2 Tax=Candidatus Accumulibacter TaxID=327159 RepID=A0A011QMA2_ACCRE|nr:MAG: hypothetical protein AW11_00802 [Candidatus Accumulibacter regalis]